jgi:hypothetical protein
MDSEYTNLSNLAPANMLEAMGFGAPAGGILCMELLKPTHQNGHPKNPKITRSAIIQSLSHLVAFLGWVNPEAPNSNLCKRANQTIQQVLDYALNESAYAPHMPESFGWDYSTQFDFDFDVMDTFDWLRAETS